jgi:hypothetical protein
VIRPSPPLGREASSVSIPSSSSHGRRSRIGTAKAELIVNYPLNCLGSSLLIAISCWVALPYPSALALACSSPYRRAGAVERAECWKGREWDPSLLRERLGRGLCTRCSGGCISDRLPVFLRPPWRPPFHDRRIVWGNILPGDLRRPTTTSWRLMIGGKRCRRWQRSFDRCPLP